VASPEIEQNIVALLAARAANSSICPSEVARAVAPDDWRRLMPQVRSIAVQMALAHRIRITRSGHELNPVDLGSGPVRLTRGSRFED
jgi:Protein of unknown function (DUF3253)